MKIKEVIKGISNKFFCCHDWQHWHTSKVEADFERYSIFHFKCKKCGKFKKVKSF